MIMEIRKNLERTMGCSFAEKERERERKGMGDEDSVEKGNI